jgi:hypothetical protein
MCKKIVLSPHGHSPLWKKGNLAAVFRLRIWIRKIRMFLGVLVPDPLVEVRFLFSNKISKKTLISTVLLLLFDFYLWKLCKCSFRKLKAKKLRKISIFYLPSWRSVTKKAGSGAESGSVPKCHGSATLLSLNLLMPGNLSSDLTLDLIQISLHMY